MTSRTSMVACSLLVVTASLLLSIVLRVHCSWLIVLHICRCDVVRSCDPTIWRTETNKRHGHDGEHRVDGYDTHIPSWHFIQHFQKESRRATGREEDEAWGYCAISSRRGEQIVLILRIALRVAASMAVLLCRSMIVVLHVCMSNVPGC